MNGIEIPNAASVVAEDAAPPEREQQGEPGDRRRQDDRQVDDRLDERSRRGTAAARADGPRASRCAIVRTRLIAVVIRDSWSASRTAGSPIATWSAPPRRARTTRTATGRPRNRPTQAPENERQGGSARGGRKEPERARGSPGPPGPATQSRKACASAAMWRGLHDDAGVGRRTLRLRRDRDRRDLRRRPGVGDVDDPGVALAELDLRHDGLHVRLPSRRCSPRTSPGSRPG